MPRGCALTVPPPAPGAGSCLGSLWGDLDLDLEVQLPGVPLEVPLFVSSVGSCLGSHLAVLSHFWVITRLDEPLHSLFHVDLYLILVSPFHQAPRVILSHLSQGLGVAFGVL